jgi:hypothetical protein
MDWDSLVCPTRALPKGGILLAGLPVKKLGFIHLCALFSPSVEGVKMIFMGLKRPYSRDSQA